MPAGTTSTCVDKSVFPSCQDLSLPHLSRCLPLSLPFDHFASTSEFPGSRAARYISDPLIVQGPRSPRASPISWNEGNRLDVQEKHFPCPTRRELSRLELLSRREEKSDIFEGSGPKGSARVSFFLLEICMVAFCCREKPQKRGRRRLTRNYRRLDDLARIF